MQFQIEFQAEHLHRALAAARLAISQPHDILANIGEGLLRVHQERHDSGLAPDGSKWKELADSTKTDGKRRGGPLNKTGDMLKSFKYQVEDSSLRLFFDGARDSKLANIHHGGTGPYVISAIKAKALHFGGIFRRRVHHLGLPARALVGMPPSDQTMVGHISADHLTQVLNRVR
jgi:hypothetical protein